MPVTRRHLLTAAGATLALGSGARAQTPTVIKFSHVVTHDTPKGKGALKFQELAGKYTDGRVKVEIYPNSQLFKDKEEMEALQLGAVQMLAPSMAKFGPLGVKEFEIFDLPYIFPDKDALRKVTEGPVGKDFLNLLQPRGITGLAFWDNGFKLMSANREIKRPDDMLGLKVRIQSSKVIEAQMKALGALPQVMAFSEVYQALQTGVVDGTENPASNMYSQKMHEVQAHAITSYHGYLGYAAIVNKAFWDGLAPEIRAGLEKAMREATAHANAIADAENVAALEAMLKSGKTKFYTPTPGDRQAWMAALLPVHKEMTARVGKDFLEAVYKAVGKSGG